ncbi:hypothetical protein AB205_0155600 [Aquarana catesbeiana]|uniref:Secreted protein n=1 Tax=Aquarana catesbeiana TaxID=8400 RepID=A0A2G9RJH9_AQUCT|nr:hypothetical protein AB205_0155600 [Aquarana catesbeiana]
MSAFPLLSVSLLWTSVGCSKMAATGHHFRSKLRWVAEYVVTPQKREEVKSGADRKGCRVLKRKFWVRGQSPEWITRSHQ